MYFCVYAKGVHINEQLSKSTTNFMEDITVTKNFL